MSVISKFTKWFGYRFNSVKVSKGTLLLSWHTFIQSIKNKRFYIVLFYFLLPVLADFFELVVASNSSYYTGKAYAVYHIHLALNSALTDWWLSIFGQMFIVLIASDIISSEFEKGTILSLKVHPISDMDIYLGKFIGITSLSSLLIILSAFIIYIVQIAHYASKYFWWVFWHSLDELLVSILVDLLGVALLITICLFFSSIFNKSLQATLITLIVVFAIQLLSSVFSFSDNLISKFSITRYLHHFLKPVFYNINLASSSGSIVFELLGFIGVILAFFIGGFLIFKNKEVL